MKGENIYEPVECAPKVTNTSVIRIHSAEQAEDVLEKYLGRRFGQRLESIQFIQCLYAAIGSREFWDMYGSIQMKGGFLSKGDEQGFHIQIDPTTGGVIGYAYMSMDKLDEVLSGEKEDATGWQFEGER